MTTEFGSEEEKQSLLNYIEESIGFATSHYNQSYLERRITSRLRRTNSESYTEYQALLQTCTRERRQLLDTLHINVTAFFRNPTVWKRIQEILRTLAEQNETISVWSAACADGRETYSIALLACADPQIETTQIDVLGSDINTGALQCARKGIYEETRTEPIGDNLDIFPGVSDYITTRGKEYRVDDPVKDTVKFEKHDLIRDSQDRTFDLVLCRNILIYIQPAKEKYVYEGVTQAINPGGYLTVGKTETLNREYREYFTTVDNHHRIYRKNKASASGLDPEAVHRRRSS